MMLYQIQWENCPINVALAYCRIKMTSYLLFFIILRDTKSPKCDVCMSWFAAFSSLKDLLMCLTALWDGSLLAVHWYQLTIRGNSLFPFFLILLFSDGIIWWYTVGTHGFSNNLKNWLHCQTSNSLKYIIPGQAEFPFLTTSGFLATRMCLLRCFWRDFHYL